MGITLGLRAVIIKGEREKEEDSQAAAKQTAEQPQASEVSVFFKEAVSLPSKNSGFEGKWHTVGRPRKLNFSHLIDSYFFHSICFLGMM